jgi:YgiT-type zinc finger domain-containing protein
MYDYPCERCDGTVREKIVRREAFKHRRGFVILEDVPIGICEACGMRYYSAHVMHRVHDVASGIVTPDHTELVPVAKSA